MYEQQVTTMRKKTHWFPDSILSVLEAASEKRGVSVSEVLRGALEEWCNRQSDDIQALAKKKLKELKYSEKTKE
jgi:hypothetical protein